MGAGQQRLLALGSAGGGSSLAIDASAGNDVESTNISWSHTCTGSNLLLLVFVYYWNDNGSISGITYNSVSMTNLHLKIDGEGRRTLGVWYLVAPATGTHTVAVTGTGSASKNGASISLVSALQSAPTANSANGNSASPSVSVTGATGDIFVDGMGKWNLGTGTPGSGQTALISNEEQNNQTLQTSWKPGAASTSMGWTISSNYWAELSVRVQPV